MYNHLLVIMCLWGFCVASSLYQTVIFSVADHAYSALASVPSVILTSMAQTMPHIRSLRSLQNNNEGVEQWREGSSLRGWQTDSEAACPLSSDRQMSPLPAWPAADQGRARRLLKWRNLRAPQGVSWSFDVQHKSRVWCWMSWGREAASAVCYKGLVWRVGKEGKILSTDRPLLYFIYFVRERWLWSSCRNLVCGKSGNFLFLNHKFICSTNLLIFFHLQFYSFLLLYISLEFLCFWA